MKKVLALDDLILIDENLISDANKIKITNDSIANTQTSNIIDFDELMKRAAEAAYRASIKTYLSGVFVENIHYDMRIFDVKTSTVHEPEFVSNPTAIFMGTNTFSNTTNEEQSYNTDIFKKTITNKSSSSVNWGISLELKANYKVFSDKFTINYNKTETITNEKTIQINAPTQKLKLPPHSRCKVDVFLGQNDFKVDLNLHACISGTLSCYIEAGISCFFNIDMATALLFLPSLPHGISVDKKNKQIIFNGIMTAKNISQNNNFSVQVTKLPLE